MKLAFLILALSLLAGCMSLAPGNHYAVTLDRSLSTEDQTTATHAVAAWTHALAGDLTIDVSLAECGHADRELCVLPATPADLTGAEMAVTTRYDERDRADVFISPASTGLTTLTHELGHAMGLVHTGPGSVMCADTSCASDAPTAVDAAQWRATR